MTDAGIQVTGLDQVAAYLADVGSTADANVDQAMGEFGKLVTTQAQGTAPKLTGAMAASVTSTYTDGTLTVKATAPHAYTFHAVALGKSGGYMVFRVGGHTRAGSYVGGYSARRPIRNDPFLFAAFLKLQNDLATKVTTAVTKAVTG